MIKISSIRSGNDHAFFPKIYGSHEIYLKEVSLSEQRDSEQWLGYQSSIAELVHPGAESWYSWLSTHRSPFDCRISVPSLHTAIKQRDSPMGPTFDAHCIHFQELLGHWRTCIIRLATVQFSKLWKADYFLEFLASFNFIEMLYQALCLIEFLPWSMHTFSSFFWWFDALIEILNSLNKQIARNMNIIIFYLCIIIIILLLFYNSFAHKTWY